MSSRAFTAVRLPIMGSNSTGRAYAESKRLTRRGTAELSEGSAFTLAASWLAGSPAVGRVCSATVSADCSAAGKR